MQVRGYAPGVSARAECQLGQSVSQRAGRRVANHRDSLARRAQLASASTRARDNTLGLVTGIRVKPRPVRPGATNLRRSRGVMARDKAGPVTRATTMHETMASATVIWSSPISQDVPAPKKNQICPPLSILVHGSYQRNAARNCEATGPGLAREIDAASRTSLTERHVSLATKSLFNKLWNVTPAIKLAQRDSGGRRGGATLRRSTGDTARVIHGYIGTGVHCERGTRLGRWGC